MCNKCKNANHVDSEDYTPSFVDVEAELDAVQMKLESLNSLHELAESGTMSNKDKNFATSLLFGEYGYRERGMLTNKQWKFVEDLQARYIEMEPIYGSFDAILVMFRLVTSKQGGSLKQPKVRLLTKEGRFVQLNFRMPKAEPGQSEISPEDVNIRSIDVYVDGWAGHGYRKFAGWIENDKIRPYRKERMTDDVKNVIQELAMDPIGTAKAMAKLLGVCMYCGQRLSDDRSKEAGYGPVCAKNWGLPWGGKKAA